MPLNTSGFVTPEQNLGGLYKLTDNLQMDAAMKQRDGEQRKAKKAASTKFFSDYLDDKAKYTGTNYDPIRHELISKALTDSMDLINQGTEINDVLAAISPSVNKANEYTQRAQQYAANEKQAISMAEKAGNIDMPKFIEALRKEAWEGKEIDQVDPNLNYADMVINKYPVLNNEQLPDYVKDMGNSSIDITKSFTNAKGQRDKGKVKVEYPAFAIPIKNEDGSLKEVVPKFKIATDGGSPLMHKFQTEHGEVDAPVRLLSDEIFYGMPKKQLAFYKQEAREYAKQHNAEIDSPQVENFAKAIAYSDLKGHIKTKEQYLDDDKEAKAPVYNFNMGEKAEMAAEDQQSFNTAMDEARTTQAGLKDVTDYLAGITLFTNGKGGTDWQADKIYFNPKTKNFTIMKDGVGEKLSFDAFKQRAKFKPGVSSSDIKSLRYYKEYNGGDKKVVKFDIINPKTGQVVLQGVDEETAKKAEAKGYKRK